MPPIPRRYALVLLVVLGPAVLSAAPAPSAITAVTVYLDRAVVTRTASVDLPAGDQVVTFENLPAGLEDDSLHVAGTGSVHATLGEVVATTNYPAATPEDRLRALQDELKAEQKQLRFMNDRAAAIEKEKVLLTRMADAAAQCTAGKDGTPPPRMLTSEMQQLLDFYGPALVKLAGDSQALDAERDPLKDKIAATTAQLKALGEREEKSTKTVTVRLAMGEAGKLALELTYAIPGAAWRPSYEARVTSADHHLSLGYYGIVAQTTGEDWKGVALTLSTARPSLGGAVPELSPWYVDRVVPAVTANFLQRERAAKSMLDGSGVLAAPAAADEKVVALEQFSASADSAQVTAGATSATFRIPGTVDVPSDNEPHKETVAVIPLAAELSYQTTPKLMPSAFLSAAVTNSSDYPILAGPLAIFLDETFVANARVKTVMPTEKFDLALGVDEGIAVERKILNRFTEDLGLITKKSRVTYNILITVTNHRRDAVKLEVRDQLPVSKQEKIEVVQVEPDAGKVKPDNQGMLKWSLDLAPGEKRELPLKFSVTYPNDLPISGLE